MITKELLTYRLVSDGARTISSATEFEKLVASLRGKNNISSICITNDDVTNLRTITVNETQVPYGSYINHSVPNVGGYIEVGDLSIKFPNGDAIVSIL